MAKLENLEKDAERIIESVKSVPDFQNMLKSVYFFNSKTGNQELLMRILEAMSIVDRRYFVEEREPRVIYNDAPLVIGEGQTISQPTTVARMLLYADLKKGDDVLEVGTGSGWNASLIAFLVYPGKVVSVDKTNIEKAENNLKKFKSYLEKNKSRYVDKAADINLLEENIFSEGEAWKRKYDKIIITAGIPIMRKEIEVRIEDLAESLLNKKGILICPYTEGPIVIYKKNDRLKREETSEYYSFIPLFEK